MSGKLEKFLDGIGADRAARAAGAQPRWRRGDRFIAAGIVGAAVLVVAVVVAVMAGAPALIFGAAHTNSAYAQVVGGTGIPTGNVCRYLARGSKVSVTKYAAQYRYKVNGKTYTVRGEHGTDLPTSLPTSNGTTVRYLPDQAEADDRKTAGGTKTLQTARVLTGDDCMRRGEPS